MIDFLTNEPVPKKLQESMNKLKADALEPRNTVPQKQSPSRKTVWILILVCVAFLSAYLYFQL